VITGERRHVAIHLDGEAAQAVDGLRAVWDPVMRARAPAHVTVVYPEETVDPALLLEELGRAAGESAPIPLRLGPLACVDGGRGGVFATVEDPTGALEALRDRLLLPPQRFRGYPFHATVAHPRTATSPADCWSSRRGRALDLPFTAQEVLWTATDEVRRQVLGGFRFAGPSAARRVSMAAGVLVADDRVLLGLRCRDRVSFPGVWDLPGGHVEPGESPRQALRRELREELAVDAVLEAPWRRIVDEERGFELWLWTVTRWQGTVRNLARGEHERLGWFAASELGSLDLALADYTSLLTEALTGQRTLRSQP
jgi:mutator protein MutT